MSINAVLIVLTEEQLAALCALLDCVIPPDAGGPGGVGGGALAYVLAGLADPVRFAGDAGTYRFFLDYLHGAKFAAMTDLEQEAFLRECETEGGPIGAAFRLLAEHAHEGFYTSAEGLRQVGFVVTA